MIQEHLLNTQMICCIEEYNPNNKRKILIVFDNMTADISNKTLNPIATKLFIRGRKLNISLLITTKSYFAVPNTQFCYQNFKQKRASTNCI